MTPAFRITADAADITATVSDRLMELRVTDAAGIKSDTADLRLDDRPPHIALPRTGAKLKISLGYRETGIAAMGTYIVDELVPAGPPGTLTIRARAADLRRGLKAPKTRSWDDVAIGDLVAAIAGEHGYSARVSAELAGVVLAHVDQTEESDLHLLTRLAADYGAVAKPAGQMLLFVPAGVAKSAGGRDLPRVALVRTDLLRWEVTIAERGKYGQVIAHWHDLATGRRIPVTVGSGDPSYSLRRTYPTAAAAIAAAQARLAAFERGAATIGLDCSGNVCLAAEATVDISDVRDGVNGAWVLTRAEHVIDDQGYRCQLEGEMSGERKS